MEAGGYWVGLFDQATGIKFGYLQPNAILIDESSFEQVFLFKKTTVMWEQAKLERERD